ncbi:hypothetical protein [Rheinheimera fenheensis]|uniref:hypothetical protein n=1 Tax=Rheinheimera fenheensis TaxID=3152295 RepID=UPI00325C5941
MQDRQYNGVVLEDKWGKTYLCSSCLLAWADLGSNTVRELADTEYGRYFLHDLEPGYNLRDIWAQLYQHARPWATDLTKLNNFQLRDTLLQMFARDEMRVWQLSDGWGKQPEGNGIGEGGLAPASSGNTSSKPAAKAAKPKGGGVTTEAPVAAKAAGHEANSSSSKVAIPPSTDASSATKYVALVSDFTGLSSSEIAKFYSDMEAIGVDYKPLIQNAMDKHGLTLDEAHAVFGYTTKLFYRDLNQNLLTGGTEQAKALSKLVSSGIEKMPDSGTTQFRGWRLDTAAQQDKFDTDFAIGNSVTSNFWSTAPSEADAYAADRNVVIHTDSAKDISDLAFGVHFHDKVGKTSYSSETIIPPGNKFTVTAIDSDGRYVLEQDI